MKKKFLAILKQMGYLASNDNLDKDTIDTYLKNATKFVKWYVHKQDWEDEDYQENFLYEIANIAAYMYSYNKTSKGGIKSKTQGSRSITYDSYVIPEQYYTILPKYPHVF